MPWLRAQAWLRLGKLLDGERAERLMRGLIARTGADPSPKDRNRVMRLAGSINWPKPDKPGRIAELVRWR